MKTSTKLIGGTMAAIAILFFAFALWRVLREESMVLTSPPPAEERGPALSNNLSAIDRILKSMEFGNIAFNAPRSMDLHDTAVIQLMLGLSTSIDELKRMIEAEGEKEGARIRVADRMEARLSGPNFAITAITPEVQIISRSDVTEWKWEVQPSNQGNQYLHLTLSALISINGASTPRAIRTFDKVIEVKVAWLNRASSFFENNWQWLWAAVLLPIGGWLWKRKKETKKANISRSDGYRRSSRP